MRDVRSWSWLDANTYEGTKRTVTGIHKRWTSRWRKSAAERHERARKRYDKAK